MEAQLLVMANDGAWPPEETLAPIREAFPHLKILARAYDRVHHLDLIRAEVDVAVREVLDGSITLGREALALLGTAPETIVAIEAEFRRRDDERLAGAIVQRRPAVGGRQIVPPGIGLRPRRARRNPVPTVRQAA